MTWPLLTLWERKHTVKSSCLTSKKLERHWRRLNSYLKITLSLLTMKLRKRLGAVATAGVFFYSHRFEMLSLKSELCNVCCPTNTPKNAPRKLGNALELKTKKWSSPSNLFHFSTSSPGENKTRLLAAATIPSPMGPHPAITTTSLNWIFPNSTPWIEHARGSTKAACWAETCWGTRCTRALAGKIINSAMAPLVSRWNP